MKKPYMEMDTKQYGDIIIFPDFTPQPTTMCFECKQIVPPHVTEQMQENQENDTTIFLRPQDGLSKTTFLRICDVCFYARY